MADRRRPKDVSLHDWQHQLIDERRQEWLETPKLRGVDKISRREAEKRAIWTLRGHIQQFHSRHINMLTSWADLQFLHEGFHEDDDLE